LLPSDTQVHLKFNEPKHEITVFEPENDENMEELEHGNEQKDISDQKDEFLEITTMKPDNKAEIEELSSEKAGMRLRPRKPLKFKIDAFEEEKEKEELRMSLRSSIKRGLEDIDLEYRNKTPEIPESRYSTRLRNKRIEHVDDGEEKKQIDSKN